MDTFEQFEEDLRESLMRLYDPVFQPTPLLWDIMGISGERTFEAMQTTILQAIEELAPRPEAPATARNRRIHELLFMRYVQKMSQDEAAERLSITPRHLRREQHQAIYVLAKRLWEKSHHGMATPLPTEPPFPAPHLGEDEASSPEGAPSGDWRAQIKWELASLQRGPSEGSARVAEAMGGVAEIAQVLTSRRNIALRVEPVEAGLFAATHPSGLRSMLMAAVAELARNMSGGQISLTAQRREQCVAITISGSPVVASPIHEQDLQELVAAQQGALSLREQDGTTTFELTLPLQARVQVLVVDDNADLVHFYQRYVEGTHYQIANIQEGAPVLQAVEVSPPDVIVLDVMLPDMDGWELLSHLHEHPVARTIPIVVCSVVREKELALALGATLYVAKPVRRQEFLSALDQALSRVGAEASTDPASSAAAC